MIDILFVSFQVVGVIFGALAIAAIAAIGAVEHTEVQNTNVIYIKELLIAMLVLLVLMGCVSLAVCYKNIRCLLKSSMTSLLTHNFAHSTRHSFRPKTNNQLLKKFLSLAFS